MMEHICVYIKRELKKHGVNQVDVSRESGVQKSHICEMLKGQRYISVSVAKAIEKYCSIDWKNILIEDIDYHAYLEKKKILDM